MMTILADWGIPRDGVVAADPIDWETLAMAIAEEKRMRRTMMKFVVCRLGGRHPMRRGGKRGMKEESHFLSSMRQKLKFLLDLGGFFFQSSQKD